MLPSSQELFTGRANHRYAREVDDFVTLLGVRGGYAYYDTSVFVPVISADELARRLPLREIARDGSFVLYKVANAS